jgi:hypothetical protein
VLKTIALVLLCGAAFAQDKKSDAQEKLDKNAPQVKINYLNVCTPTKDEQAVLDNALSTLPSKPPFGAEFEVARGRSTMPDEGPGSVKTSGDPSVPAPFSTWVRIRKEFASGTLSNVQYTFSRDQKNMTETLVFRMKSPKQNQPMMVSIQDSVSAPTATQALAANTPPNRIRVERFGGSSVVLARCEQADQKQYEAFFSRANTVMTNYRKLMDVRTTVPADLARVR